MKNILIRNNTKCRKIKEDDGFENLYKRYLVENDRNQKTYIMVYGVPSTYLEKHKQLFTWIRNNREYLTKEQENFILYNLFCREVDLWHKKSNITTYKENISRLNSAKVNNCYIYNPEKDLNKSSFVFNYPSDQLRKISDGYIMDKFNKEKVVCYNSLKNKKLFFIQKIIKLFPSAYIITIDSSLMNKLMRKKDLEIGVIRSRNFYKCTLHIKNENMEKFFFSNKKAKTWDNRLCKKYYGKNYCEYLTKYDCSLNCKYYLDHIKCSRSHTVGMRPFTFFVETTFSSNSFEFKPRSLVIIDNVKLLIDNLKKFYTFELSIKDCKNLNLSNNFKENISILLENEIYKEKTYEKKGWLSLIKQLQNTPPKNGLWPSKPHKYYNESDTYLYKILLKENRSCFDGLNNNDYKKLCDIKKTIYSMKLSKKSSEPYIIEKIDGKYIFTPNNYNHLIKAHIKPYGSYFLLLNTLNSEYYKDDFVK